MLKVGGYLCALISGRTSAYKIASEDKVLHPIVYLTDSDVREGIVEAGLRLEEFQTILTPPSGNPGGIKEIYVFLASSSGCVTRLYNIILDSTCYPLTRWR